MADTYPNKPFEHFYHGEQTRNYILQFMTIFSGLQVSTGKNDYNSNEQNLIYVPVRYGSRDKVVESILSSQTSNKPIRVPVIAAKMTGIELAPDLRKGMNQEYSRTYLPRGESFPDGAKVITQMQPNPCRLFMEVSIFTSNLKNKNEIMEQILMLFNPMLDIFTSDDFEDHYKISKVELVDMNIEEDYPSGTDISYYIDTLNFAVDAYYRAPINLKKKYIKAIKLRLDTISKLPAEQAVVEINSSDITADILFDVDDLDMPEN